MTLEDIPEGSEESSSDKNISGDEVLKSFGIRQWMIGVGLVAAFIILRHGGDYQKVNRGYEQQQMQQEFNKEYQRAVEETIRDTERVRNYHRQQKYNP